MANNKSLIELPSRIGSTLLPDTVTNNHSFHIFCMMIAEGCRKQWKGYVNPTKSKVMVGRKAIVSIGDITDIENHMYGEED